MNERTVNTDEFLIERFKEGHQSSFDILVIKYQSKVKGIITKFIKNDPAIADDIAQEAFIKAYNSLEKFRGDSAFYTWLYRIAVNCTKNYLASKKRKVPFDDLSIDDEETFFDNAIQDNNTPESELLLDETYQRLQETLNNLPETLRSAITLREVSGLSYEEIAEIADCPVGTVRSRIFRARETLAASLLNK